MSTDTGRERIDEERRPRRMVVRLTPGAKPGQAGERSTDSPSQKSVVPSAPMEKNVSHGPQEKAGVARGAPMPPIRPGRLRYYGLALLFVGGAALLRWALSDVLRPAPSLIFYLAWVGAAAFGGLGPGLLATVASWLCVELLFDFTPGHIGFVDSMSIARLGVFLAGGLVVSVVGERMRRTRIHERRQGRELADANAALRASEEKYRIVADNTYDWEFWLDPEGRFLYTSPSCERITGYDAREFLNRPGLLQEIVHPEDLQAFLEHQHPTSSNQHGDIEFRIVTKHDEMRWIHHLCQPICDKEGRCAGCRGSNRDITERKLAEEALRASAEKYRLLVENSKDVTWTVDVQGRWTFISANMEKVTGYRADELIGRMLRDFLAPESRDLVKEKLRRRLRGEDLPPYEVMFVGKDGRPMPFEVVAASIVDVDGNIVGVQGVSRDITERQRAEEALRESEKRYRGIVEDQTELICLFEGDETITFVNDAYCRYFGKKREELVGHKFLPLIAEEDREAVKAQIAALNLENPFVAIEQRVRRPDGNIAWQEWKNRAVVDGQGHLTGYQAVGRDITERKQAEQDLSESRNRYQALIETTADFIWEMDASGKYTYCSPQMKGLWGYEPKDMIGKTPFDVMPPEDRKQAIGSFMSLAKSPKPFTGLEASSYDSQGRLITVEISGVPFFDADGRLLGYRGISRDVTERRRAQEALAESRREYRGLVERINDWVWEIDAKGVYTYSSPRARELLGYAPEEIVGKTPFDFMPPAEAQRVWNAFEPVWLERKPLELLENTLVRKDGRPVTVETSGMPVFADDGSFLGYMGIDRDVTARKWAEEQLRRSEQDLNRAQAVAQTGSWRLDVRRDELLWSHETHRIFGIPDGTPMTYETFLAAVHPEDREYVDRKWTVALRGEPYDIEHRILAEGRLKWVRERAELEFDEVGTLIGGFGTVQDITERKRAEEALRASQAMLQLVMESVPQGIFWKDRHSTYLGCNKVFAQAAGLESAGDIVGKTDYDLPWSSEQTASFREYDRRIMENDAPEYHIIEQQREVGGKLAWLETNKVPLHDAQGHVIGLLGTYEDVTERQRAEEALQASEEKYRFLVENSKDITWTVDLQGRWTFISSNVENVVGYRADEVIGRTIWDFLAPECHDGVKEKLRRRRHGEEVLPYEVLVVGNDGRRIPFELHTAPIVDDAGNIVGVQGVSRDITERKKAEEALREWNATLESKVAQRTEELEHRAGQLQKLTLELTEAEERERERLAEILHDDLQQVLAAAKFQMGLLTSRVRDDAESHEIAEQTRDLLGDAIAKSRSLSHELSAPVLSRSDLSEAFEWLAEQMQTKHGFTVHLDMGGRIELASEPLRVLLYKAAQELLFNASKHAGVHEAKLRLRHRRGRLQLLVSDAGRGVDFTEPGHNLGFGLLSIRERVEYLGGRLRIRSAIGKGSIFLITVPDTEVSR